MTRREKTHNIDSTDSTGNIHIDTHGPEKFFRPWGFYEILDELQGYKVKRIFIKQGHRISLQRHTYRSEHWTIVQGTAFVTIDGVSSHREAGVAVHVQRGAVHRIAAPLGDVIFIEVQTGPYLGEDDIERLEDDYNRMDTTESMVKINVEPSDMSGEDFARRLAQTLSKSTGLRIEPYDAKKYQQFNSAEELEKSTPPCDCGSPELCNPELSPDDIAQASRLYAMEHPEENLESLDEPEPSYLHDALRSARCQISDIIALRECRLITHDEARDMLGMRTGQEEKVKTSELGQR